MKAYIEPVVHVIEFTCEHVMTASSFGGMVNEDYDGPMGQQGSYNFAEEEEWFSIFCMFAFCVLNRTFAGAA